MSQHIEIQPMDKAAFAPFGDVLDCAGDPDKIINQGMCGRYHDRAQLDFAGQGHPSKRDPKPEPQDMNADPEGIQQRQLDRHLQDRTFGQKGEA